MDKKKKIGLIGFALIAFLVTSTAVTVYVDNINEGKAVLGTSNKVSTTGCKVYSIQKIAQEQKDFDEDWIVTFALEYTYENQEGRMVETREGVKTTKVASDTEAAVKAATEPICDQDWIIAQSRHGTIDTIIVEPKTNPVLSQIYDPIKKAWNNISATP